MNDYTEKYLNEYNYKQGMKLAEEIGAMLWKEVENLERSVKRQLLSCFLAFLKHG